MMRRNLASRNRQITSVRTTESKRSSVIKKNRISIIFLAIPAVLLTIVAVVILVFEQWTAYNGLTIKRIDLPLVIDDHFLNHKERLWGSFMNGVGFGFKPRIPNSLSVGLLWMFHNKSENSSLYYHETDFNTDDLGRFWLQHDGASFGQQNIIIDNLISLAVDFILVEQGELGHTWTIRVTANPIKHSAIVFSLILYIYNNGRGEMGVYRDQRKGSVEEVFGHTPEFRDFRLYFPHKLIARNAIHSYSLGSLSSTNDIFPFVLDHMEQKVFDEWTFLLLSKEDTFQKNINFVAYQVASILNQTMQMDLVFESGVYSAAMSISGSQFTAMMLGKQKVFDKRFEDTFSLKFKGFDKSHIDFAKMALCQVLGSLSYQYNNIRVNLDEISEPSDYFFSSFYGTTSTCSKCPVSLSDNSYNLLLLVYWDIDIAKDVLGHWFDMMNFEGWIPGLWSLNVDNNTQLFNLKRIVVYSPTVFLSLEYLLERMILTNTIDLPFLNNIYLRLQAWFDWLDYTQRGVTPSTYMWERRDDYLHEYSCNGLEDLPRTNYPSRYEYHLDLRCWMAEGAKVLVKMANILNRKDDLYLATFRTLTDVKLLNSLHWDDKRKIYADYGLDSTIKVSKSESKPIVGHPSLRFVNSFGYINLFPLFFKILPPTSPKLGFLLKYISSKSVLWSEFGLRSFSKKNLRYKMLNESHFNMCSMWTGPVHISMNYLALRSLKHYSNVGGPYSSIASKLYSELRPRIIATVKNSFDKTRQFWSYYDDVTGDGLGTPNKNWQSALVILIMAEKY